MKKLLTTIILTLITISSFACHYSTLTLNGGPTPIGGGLYSTDVTVCIGQKQNFGATNNFALCFDIPISSASGANFPTVTNTYNICGGPCGPTQSVTAIATATISGNCITNTTTSSTPAGYPLVPDRYDGGAGAAGNSNSFCFTITIVTVGYPTTLDLGGGVEADPGVSGNDGIHLMCQDGNADPGMTITFPGNPLPIELIYFGGELIDGFSGKSGSLSWLTASEINNDYFILERSNDGYNYEIIHTVSGSGNTSTTQRYKYIDIGIKGGNNYYKLTQFDFNGLSETLNTIVISNELKERKLVKVLNFMGQEVSKDSNGLLIYLYSDGTIEKVVSQ